MARQFWFRRGYYHQARSWLEQAAQLTGEMSAPVRAAALAGAGVLAFLQCDYQLATQRLSQVRALHEAADDQVGVAAALQHLGSIAREQARYDEAYRLHEESMAIWAGLDEPAGVAVSLDYLGFAAWLEGDYARASAHCGQALAFFEASGVEGLRLRPRERDPVAGVGDAPEDEIKRISSQAEMSRQ